MPPLMVGQIGLLTEDRYDQYIDEVMSLPPKQRKKWRITSRDLNGVKRRLYYDGCFKIQTERGIVNVGAPSSVRCVEELVGERVPALHARHPGHGEAFQARINENLTGNHYRNRYVRIPTAPGEPVRG